VNLVVYVLEKYLEAARQDKFKGIAVSAVGVDGFQWHDFCGEVPYEVKQKKSLEELLGKVNTSIDNWTPPEYDPSLDQSYAMYHCGNSPNGFDFLVWLVIHDMLRVKHGAPPPLKVAFWQGKTPMKFDWVDNVYRPSLGLIGAVEDNRALGYRGHNAFVSRVVVELHKEGIPVPRMHATKEHDLPRDAITITLREANHCVRSASASSSCATPRRPTKSSRTSKSARWHPGILTLACGYTTTPN
jgi:hypothetical protein